MKASFRESQPFFCTEDQKMTRPKGIDPGPQGEETIIKKVVGFGKERGV